MGETNEQEALLRVLVRPGLIAAGVCVQRANGDLQYVGVRPSGGWHVHGWCRRWLRVLIDGEVRRVRLFKSRWRRGRKGPTCHNRPPDERAFIRLSSILLVLKLYGWLDGNGGLHSRQPSTEPLPIAVSPRTMLRWFHRALPHALAIQQAIREAVIERCEPRPMEQLFPSGLSPPDGFLRRRWTDAASTIALWRGFALLFGAAIVLDLNPTFLLAEARGRMCTPEDFPL